MKAEKNVLLRSLLPKYVFAVNPAIKTFRDNPLKADRAGVPPTIIEQEVVRAQASAELNVYLSYLSTNQKKIEFLQEWEAATKVKPTGGSSVDMMNKLKIHLWKEHNEPKHPEGTKKAGKNLYFVHDFDPLQRPRKIPGTTPVSLPGTRWGSIASALDGAARIATSSLRGESVNFSKPNYQPDASSKSGSAKNDTGGGSPKSSSTKSTSPKSTSPKDKKVGEKKQR